jgi:hypothetical protein
MTKTANGFRYQLVSITRIAAGHYALKNVAGALIEFTRLTDAQSYVAGNWSMALVEAQYSN